ncbi:Wzz/FepE/Etk N-terminal domain-containing protein [Kitasatospora sp. NPDC048540]|uniref:Wzz/FepE/Etk N-terminal domain-containing protein n=1 Tax=Kitasatospora sp. NPDC048540 TaxID=3155634 RepID=UPI0034078CAD
MSDLRRSARALARRWWPVAVAVPLGAVAGAGYAAVSHPSYTADSYVVVVPAETGDGAAAVNFAQAYGRLAGQPQVLAAAAAQTGHSIAELAGLVSGTTSPDAPVIDISGSGGRPRDAVRAADAVAGSLITFANASSKETGVRLVPLAPAAEPEKPTTPSAALDTGVGAAAGVLAGALVMLTRRRPAADPSPDAVPDAPAEERSGPPRPRGTAATEPAAAAPAGTEAAAAPKRPAAARSPR